MPLEHSVKLVLEREEVIISAPRPTMHVKTGDETGKRGDTYLHVMQPLFTWKPPARIRYCFVSADDDDMTDDTSRRKRTS